jgi:hypothetical protein
MKKRRKEERKKDVSGIERKEERKEERKKERKEEWKKGRKMLAKIELMMIRIFGIIYFIFFTDEFFIRASPMLQTTLSPSICPFKLRKEMKITSKMS